MKLRISGDSLRLRLSRSEVERLRQSAEVEDAIHFGGDNQMQYIVAIGNGVLGATYTQNQIRVEMPREVAGTDRAQPFPTVKTIRMSSRARREARTFLANPNYYKPYK